MPPNDKPGEDQPEQPSLSSFIVSWLRARAWHHVGLVVSAVVVGATGIRIFVAADYRLPTALALLRSSNSFTVLLGTALFLFPYALALLGMFTIRPAVHYVRRNGRTGFSGWADSGAFTLVMFGVGLFIVVVPIAFLALMLATGLLAVFDRADRPFPGGWGLASLIALLLVLQVLVNPALWVPEEVVGLANRTHVVGYVMSETGGWTSVLTDSDRKVLLIRSADIRSQVICEKASWGASVLMSLPEFAHRSGSIPACRGG